MTWTVPQSISSESHCGAEYSELFSTASGERLKVSVLPDTNELLSLTLWQVRK